MSKSQNVINYRQRRKLNLINICGNQCCLCGYNKAINALEFHHLDSSQKDYGIAASGICHDLETDFAEVKKCILVCANCHREIHNGQYSLEELQEKQVFNEELANQLRQEKFIQEHGVQVFCKKCGKQITKESETGLCFECYHDSVRKATRPDRETLKQMIRTMSFVEIGKQFGVSDNAIRKWCKAMNLPSKKTDINNFSNQEWEKI